MMLTNNNKRNKKAARPTTNIVFLICVVDNQYRNFHNGRNNSQIAAALKATVNLVG